MRKLFWCCTAAGVLVVVGLFSASHYASHHPETTMGRCLTSAASASVVLQPVVGIGSVVAKATQHIVQPDAAATAAGSTEHCVPNDPIPIAPDPVEKPPVVGVIDMPVPEADLAPPPIVIPEDDPMPLVEEAVPPPATIDLTGLRGQELPDSACPLVMPYCTDDDEPAPKPKMPYAYDGDEEKYDGDYKKPADGSGKSEENVFKAWMKLFEETSEESKSGIAEEPGAETKCQEDSHLHEHYPGCPNVTCPYTGRSYPPSPPAAKKKGKEEPSEEPILAPKKNAKKGCKGKDGSCAPTEGVDTMEYRKSDGGLNEYGPGPF